MVSLNEFSLHTYGIHCKRGHEADKSMIGYGLAPYLCPLNYRFIQQLFENIFPVGELIKWV